MAKAITAYEHIQSNNFKTILLILLFPISLVALFYVVCAVVFSLDSPGGFQSALPMINKTVIACMPIVAGIGLIWMFFSCLFGDKMMLGFAGAKPLDGTTAENQEIPTDDSVTLSVPGTTKKSEAYKYVSQISWTLADTPE